MPRQIESTVSGADVEYLKSCGILAPGRWPEEPSQAQMAYAESMALLRLFQSIRQGIGNGLDAAGHAPNL